MIGKIPGWLHSLHLFKFFPDLTNFFKFHSQGASQQQILQRSVFYWASVRGIALPVLSLNENTLWDSGVLAIDVQPGVSKSVEDGCRPSMLWTGHP
jgi:hypothetical protein